MLAPVESFIDTGVNGLTAHLGGPMTLAATLYIALYGWFVLKGSIQEPAMDFVFKCMKIVIIVTLATKAGDYNTYVKNLFFNTLPDEIGTALNVSQTGINGFDGLMDKGLMTASTLWAKAGVGPGIVLDAILCFVILVVTSILAGIGFIVGFYAKVGLSLVLAVGPVFIALALFQPTRRFTETWLGQLANFTILQILTVAVGSLILQSLSTLLENAASLDEAMTAMITFAAISLCASYIFYQLPGIASALAGGGASLSLGSGANNPAPNAATSAVNGAYATAKYASSKAASMTSWGINKLRR